MLGEGGHADLAQQVDHCSRTGELLPELCLEAKELNLMLTTEVCVERLPASAHNFNLSPGHNLDAPMTIALLRETQHLNLCRSWRVMVYMGCLWRKFVARHLLKVTDLSLEFIQHAKFSEIKAAVYYRHHRQTYGDASKERRSCAAFDQALKQRQPKSDINVFEKAALQHFRARTHGASGVTPKPLA